MNKEAPYVPSVSDSDSFSLDTFGFSGELVDTDFEIESESLDDHFNPDSCSSTSSTCSSAGS